MAKYQKVGGGTVNYGVYRKKKTDWGAVFAVMFVVAIVVAIAAN